MQWFGAAMVLELVLKRKTQRRWPRVVLTFCLVTLSWIFFRSNTVEQAVAFLGALAEPWNLAAAAELLGMTALDAAQIVLVLLHLPGLHRLSLSMDAGGKRPKPADVTYVYYLIVILCAWLLRLEHNAVSTFIYFQF